MKAALKTERGQPCPRVESEAAVRADKAVRAPEAIETWIETVIGRVPSDWKVVTLSEVGEVRYGLGQPPEQADDGVPMIRATNIKRGRIVTNGLIHIKREAIPESRNPYLKLGDIVVVRSGAYTGDVAMVTEDWAGAVAGYDLVVSPSDLLAAGFGAAVLLSDRVQSYFHGERARSAQPHLNRHQLERTVIPLPKRSEQQKIAAVLGLVQRAMEQQERLLALTAELKKALLHQLFTRGLRHEPQKQTDIGPVPDSWEVVELGHIAEKISKGSSPRWQGFEYLPDGVLFVRSQNVGNGRLEIADRVYLSPKFNEQEKRSILRNEDILINLVGASIGRVALGTSEIEGANCNQAVGFVRLSRELPFKKFLVSYLLSPKGQEQMFLQKKDIARANLSLLDLKGFKVPVPAKDESKEIADVFSAIETKLSLCQRKHAALTALFRTLLHQLMTAQVRVHDLDLPELEAASERRQPCPRVESEAEVHADKAVRAP